MSQLVEVKVPDIGDFTDIPVIEILVKPGDIIKKEDSLISLESDKATMEVPSTHAGVVKELKVKLGDKVSMGSAVLILEESIASASATATPLAKVVSIPSAGKTPSAPASNVAPERVAAAPSPVVVPGPVPTQNSTAPIPGNVHAGPSVRAFARELGVDLTKVKGTALKGRITRHGRRDR